MFYKCESCGDEVDDHADNHDCEGALRDRVEALEARVEQLHTGMQTIRETLNDLKTALRKALMV